MMSTTKNPLRDTKDPRRSIKTTFNVNDIIEDWTKTDGGVLSEEKQKVINNCMKPILWGAESGAESGAGPGSTSI